MGQRWEEGKQWNLKLEDEQGFKVDPALSLAEDEYEIKQIQFPYFNNEGNGVFERPIAAKQIELADGEQKNDATVYDLMTSQYGIRRSETILEAQPYK